MKNIAFKILMSVSALLCGVMLVAFPEPFDMEVDMDRVSEDAREQTLQNDTSGDHIHSEVTTIDKDTGTVVG